jgi:hypothetical protein
MMVAKSWFRIWACSSRMSRSSVGSVRDCSRWAVRSWRLCGAFVSWVIRINIGFYSYVVKLSVVFVVIILLTIEGLYFTVRLC